jgi:hypothetical protein
MSKRQLVRFALFGWVMVAAISLTAAKPLFAQNCGGFFNRQVGGISISTEGVLSDATPAERSALLADMKAKVSLPPAALDKSVGLRMVSLRGLNAACQEALRAGTPLPDEIRFLSGMQRIQYVFVHPERNDIVLAGPGEGWRVDERAVVVGASSGRPVMQIADLLVALRTVDEAGKQAISCSIDPTDEGRRQFDAVLRKQRQFNPAVIAALEKAMGQQQISLTGIPDDSHFAHVLVAADYRMKRLAMGLEKAPIAGLPSYLEMLKTKRGKLENAMPRWWLACNYEPLLRSEDGLAWELRGPGVKALTEDDFIDGVGGVKGAGKASPLAQEWADRLTAKYDELSVEEPIFGELRNLMDMCVVAALLHKENLWEKAKCSVPVLASASEFELASWHIPKHVSTECSFLKAGKEYIITASGGVQIESFAVAGKSKIDGRLVKTRTTLPTPAEGKWWWQ